MMEKHEIEVIITPEGDVRLVTHGIKGPKCLDVVKFLEEALGVVKNREHTGEYYEPEAHITDRAQVKERPG